MQGNHPVRCEWFALCTNETTKGLNHPILGLVPCCERCVQRIGGEAAELQYLDLDCCWAGTGCCR